MKLSIIILTYNSRKWIGPCITSIQKTIHTQPVEWIIIDNGSTDGSVGIVKEMLPNTILIENIENRGVAAARNQGIHIAKGEYILLLDDDTQVLPQAIDLLCGYLDQHPQCGLVAPQLYNPDGTLQANALLLPTVSGKTKRIVRKIIGSPNINHYQHSIINQHIFEPGYVIGACQLIRRSTIEETGLLDESIFYGPEDADFCLRVKQKGYKVVCLPQAKVIHAYQQKSYKLKNLKILSSHTKGLIKFWKKHYFSL